MSTRSILNNNFSFNLCKVNTLKFNDGTSQITAYTGSVPPPTPTETTYTINTLTCTNSIIGTLETPINLVNVDISTSKSLYFQNEGGDNINNINITFNNNYNGNFTMTLDNITNYPYDTCNYNISIINSYSGVINYGSLVFNKNGLIQIIFNNIIIQQTTTYTLNLYTIQYI
jgi:hypothetical protein